MLRMLNDPIESVSFFDGLVKLSIIVDVPDELKVTYKLPYLNFSARSLLTRGNSAPYDE
jgi:hypothetical protein